MGLNVNRLEKELKELYNSVSDVEIEPAKAREQLAKGVAEAIHKYIINAKVVVDAGIDVQTTGSATAQTGKTTAKGSGKIT